MKRYIIKGECVPKARAKFNRYGGTYGKAFERQVKYERDIKRSLLKQDVQQVDGALFLMVNIYKPYLKNWTKKEVAKADRGEMLAVRRPDVDNYVKSVVDGAEGFIYKDDSSIVSMVAQKGYASDPYVEIGVIPYNEIKNDLDAFLSGF